MPCNAMKQKRNVKLKQISEIVSCPTHLAISLPQFCKKMLPTAIVTAPDSIQRDKNQLAFLSTIFEPVVL
jgi:hypothetical protein